MDPETQMIVQAAATVLGFPAISKGVGKLLETMSHQVDLMAEPFHVRRKAAAESDAKTIKVLGDERAKLLKQELKGIARGQYDQAIELAILQADRRLKNISSVVIGASRIVSDSVTDKAVDQDWLTQFLVHCQDVGNAEMQSLWSQLLAGEIEEPGSFSLRTLAAVKLFSSEDAHLFTKLCKLVWTEDGGDSVARHVLLPFTTSNSLPLQSELTFKDLTHLESVGLIRLVHQGSFHLKIDETITLQYGGQSFRVARDSVYFARQVRPAVSSISHAGIFDLGPVELTDIGLQLAPIAGATPSEEHLTWVRTEYLSDGWLMTPV